MALGDGITWDESTPTDATTANTIDDYDRDLRKGVRSRMALEHEWPSSQSATSQGGVHKFISFQSQASVPVISGTQVGSLYMSSGNTLMFSVGTSTGTPVTLAHSGQVVQVVNTVVGAVATGTVGIPMDNSIPQITEGNQFMTLSITPTIGNIIQVNTNLFGVNSDDGDPYVTALFLGTTADAVAVCSNIRPDTRAYPAPNPITYFMTASTSAAHVFTVRAGGISGTFTFNGSGGVGLYGGRYASTIVITEYKG